MIDIELCQYEKDRIMNRFPYGEIHAKNAISYQLNEIITATTAIMLEYSIAMYIKYVLPESGERIDRQLMNRIQQLRKLNKQYIEDN